MPGSPVFLVQLCAGARHLEVQVVGDGQGQAIALGGRDCSTQRRFQKIFEEGPPIVAPDDVFVDMMKSAVQLCKSLNYRSAGTIEYLYQPDTKKYYFLELNPRLQVEHPVTEGITGVSLPGTQLHIAMGIPLYNVPEVRAFYGKDFDGIGEFDLNEFKPNSQYDRHVIAARITAENPDEGFKPTSGKIERINFQSSTKVWGYFSVMADGGVHECAAPPAAPAAPAAHFPPRPRPSALASRRSPTPLAGSPTRSSATSSRTARRVRRRARTS